MSQDIEAPDPNTPAEPKRPAPRLKIPVPPDLPLDDPEAGSPHRRLSTMVGVNSLLLLVLLLMSGFGLFQQRREQARAGQGPDAAGPGDAQGASSEVDRLKSEIAGLTKKLGEMPVPPDPTPQIKSLDDKVADLGKSFAEVPARLDTLSQKVDAASKGEGFAPAPKVEAIDKKVGDLTQAVDALKAEVAGKPGPGAPAATPAPAAAQPNEDVNVEGQAMEQAADLFKQGKFAEAKAAFTKLQSVFPDDARVWYFSALANGLATQNWKGESERLANLGLAKEKAGTPDRAKIDAVFANLSAANGKDWLTFFRKQAAH